MKELGQNIRLQQHPLSSFGMKMGRNVVIIRLASGKLVIHSTAAFSGEDVEEIRSFGEPGWILDATNLHDTFATHANSSFPGIPYLVPEGFGPARKTGAKSLGEVPPEWNGEIDVIPVGGMPWTREHVFFHRESGTLIVADLLFNLRPDLDAFTRVMLRLISGIRVYPGNSRMFRFMIRDREAFAASLKQILSLDFHQVVVGHGDPVTENAKETVRRIFSDLGYAV